MHTVNAADQIGVPVLAVPGSIRSPQSEGTNAIIRDGGAAVALAVVDVVAALELALAVEGGAVQLRMALDRPGTDADPGSQALAECTDFERAVLHAVDDSVTPVDQMCERTGAEL